MTNPPREQPAIPEITEIRDTSLVQKDALDYDAETATYRASFDSRSESVCWAVVSVVAAITERRPTELPALGSIIDPDALSAVLHSSATDPSQGDVHVTFRYADQEVTVHSYGVVAVRPGDE